MVDKILDVGVAADDTYESSNYLEQWYPHKSAITAVGLDDVAYLEKPMACDSSKLMAFICRSVMASSTSSIHRPCWSM